MTRKIFLDTSYIITLFDDTRQNHDIAQEYFNLFIANKLLICIPTIVVAELSVLLKIEDLPEEFTNRLLWSPFNFLDAIETGRINGAYIGLYKISTKPNRDALKDDFKIIAQANLKDDSLLITADRRTMKRFSDILSTSGHITLNTIDVSDGFNAANLDQKESVPYNPNQKTFVL